MPSTNVSRLARPGAPTLAFRRTDGCSPGILFCGGFRSDMSGTKATALAELCRTEGRAYTRFDYSGHGLSEGDFADGTIGGWLADTLTIIDQATHGPLVIVGSSMGGWMMLLAALARPDRVSGLIGIAAAPDFTERLIWQRFDERTQARLLRDNVVHMPSAYDPGPYPITRQLIEEGRNHLLLDRPIAITAPVRLLHGMADPDVPWTLSLDLTKALAATDVRVHLMKDGDHRLSRPSDIALLEATLRELTAAIA